MERCVAQVRPGDAFSRRRRGPRGAPGGATRGRELRGNSEGTLRGRFIRRGSSGKW